MKLHLNDRPHQQSAFPLATPYLHPVISQVLVPGTEPFHVVEHVKVKISEDVKMVVKGSNHGTLFLMFKLA